jgi:hypothetical protein
MLTTDTYRLKIIFTAPLLGSQPTYDIAPEYIARRNNIVIDEEEAALLPDLLERGTTVFHRLPAGGPALMNYHVMGFFKEAARALNGKVTGGVRNLRYKVSAYIIVSPRILPLHLPAGALVDYFERPLRAETATGSRVAIARSEEVPEATWFEAGLEVIRSEIGEEVLRDLLDYGFSHGFGQWRTSGFFGTFRYELDKEA